MDRTQKLFRYFFLLGTFLSGFVSLVYQLAWQRYLAILIGSEAKSSAIVISVFLVGLAIGYYLFGRLMEKDWNRQFSTKIYGYVELIIGIYAVAFPLMFPLFKRISFSGPDFFVFDIFVVSLCLLFPTILMGASIPVLTTVLPDSVKEVNTTHAKIYGWNTLGACLGVLVGGFYLLPNYGIPFTMLFSGVINILLAFIFLTNKLKGSAHQPEAVKPLNHKLTSPLIYLLVFTVGLVTISFETVLLRLVGLSIGSSVIVFPIVLSVFIFGLGLGSLLLPRLESSRALYKRLVAAMVLWILVFLTVPYWGLWSAHVRVSLTTIPSNYWVFNVSLVLMFALIFFMPVFLMGQILPIGYSLLDKSGQDYGKKCGYLYSLNTLGTALGGILFGYLLLYFTDLDTVFRLNIILLGAVCIALSLKEKLKIYSVLGLVLAVVVIFPSWDRRGHLLGYFRIREVQPDFFKGFFNLKNLSYNPLSLDDGPNTTVAILSDTKKMSEEEKFFLDYFDLSFPITVSVNGKSDGNTFGDFSTMYFTSALPYLYASKRDNIDVALVGFGTGISAGTLGKSKDVHSIDVIEISSALLEAIPTMEGANFKAGTLENANYIHSDAFRHFTRVNKKYDLIITEPSNPWVTGVENLFTGDFLELAKTRLHKNGLMAMWIQEYGSDNTVIRSILRNVAESFKNFRVYQIGMADLLILMSDEDIANRHIEKRMAEGFHQKALSLMRIKSESDLELMTVLNKNMVKVTTLSPFILHHSLEAPTLADRANRFRFLGQAVSLSTIMTKDSRAKFFATDERIAAFKNLLRSDQLKEPCHGVVGVTFFCNTYRSLLDFYSQFTKQDKFSNEKLIAYDSLREAGVIFSDPDFLLEALSSVAEEVQEVDIKKAKLITVLTRLLVIEDVSYDKILQLLSQFKNKLTPDKYDLLLEDFKELRLTHERSKRLAELVSG